MIHFMDVKKLKFLVPLSIYMNNKSAGLCTITLLLCAVEAGAQMYTENAGVRNMFK